MSDNNKSCFDCQHFNVCKFAKLIFNEGVGFIDTEKPPYKDYFNKVYGTVAENCIHYLPRKTEQS